MNQVKEKVQVYKRYLEMYLIIFSGLAHKFPEVRIYEPFAGNGKEKFYDKSGDFFEGSVKVAIPIIEKKLAEQSSNKINIQYFVNDNDPNKYEELQTNFNIAGREWLHISKLDARQFIHNHLSNKNKNIPSLWFIDPYGYTQVDKSDFKNIYLESRSDIIIFIPTHFITRFLGKQDSEQQEPIKKLLEIWDIDIEKARQSKGVPEFEKLLVNSLEQSDSRIFVKPYTLDFDSPQNRYSLLFISKSILAADKFLESTRRVYKEIRGGLFTDNNPWKITLEQVEYLIRVRPYNNVELYEWGIRHNLLAPELSQFIKMLIAQAKIKSKPFNQDAKIRKGSTYITRDNYQNKVKKILFYV
ncbi:MAG: three-Cys-motif partner protein TcmP [Gammaproteobacteria bacterium]|nr:three-Cys-motif partner protein TcmP [Gammaproteobacteria bacterium]